MLSGEIRTPALPESTAVPREAVLQALTSQASLDLTSTLSQLTMPTLVIHGRLDQARPIAHAEWLVKHLPHAELLPFDYGHTPMVEVAPAFERQYSISILWLRLLPDCVRCLFPALVK